MITQKFANHYGYSDVNPYEIVRVVSDKTIEIREMKTERDESVKLEFVPGGFSAICLNDRDQKWFISSDEEAPVIRIRLGKHGWKDAHGRRFDLAEEPRKYYDYNF
jgi:hypothetical protein